MSDTWNWTFLGFESLKEGRPVQTWFDGLPEEEKDEIRDTLVYLEKIVDRRWPEASYDPLSGAGGISEIKVPEFRGLRHGVIR